MAQLLHASNEQYEDPLRGDPIQGDLLQPPGVKPVTPSSIPTANDANIHPRRQGSGDVFDRLRKQEEKIYQLQSRLAYLERNAEPPPDYRSGSTQRDQHFLGEPAQSAFGERLKLMPKESADEVAKKLSTDSEIRLFRGKGYKTQFYGSSFPGSLLSDVRVPPILAQICPWLSVAVSGSSSISRGDSQETPSFDTSPNRDSVT